MESLLSSIYNAIFKFNLFPTFTLISNIKEIKVRTGWGLNLLLYVNFVNILKKFIFRVCQKKILQLKFQLHFYFVNWIHIYAKNSLNLVSFWISFFQFLGNLTIRIIGSFFEKRGTPMADTEAPFSPSLLLLDILQKQLIEFRIRGQHAPGYIKIYLNSLFDTLQKIIPTY